MYMTDMLMQMTLQSGWQLPELAQPTGGKPDGTAQGTTFQDLLEQRRSDMAHNGGQDSDAGKAETAQREETSNGTVKPTGTAPQAENAAMGAMLLPSGQILVEQPVQVQEEPVLAAVGLVTATVETGESGVVQQAAEAVVSTLPGQEQQVQQGQQVLEAPTGNQTAEMEVQVSVPQGGQNMASAGEESGAGNALSQEMTRPDVQQSTKTTDTMETETAVSDGWQTPLFRDVESTPVRVGDAVVDMTAPDQEVRNALSNTLKEAVEQGSQRLEIRLTPENLGTVVAEFVRSPEGALHVILHAETEQTARLLNDHASALSLLLQDGTHGQVRVEVSQPQQEQSSWQQPDQQHQQQQQQQQRQQQTPRQEAETFLHQLRLGLVEMETQAL